MAAQTLAGMRGPVDVREPDMDPVSASAQALDAHGHNIYLDSSISFEAYHFWAERAREEEKHFETESVATQFKKLFSREKKQQQQQLVLPDDSAPIATAEKDGSSPAPDKDSEARFGITAGEWEHANRAARTATWTTIFYLITTDILGPYTVPWALAQMGYGPGITLYVVFAGFAAYGGFLLWWQFVGLDSPKYPLRNYGDLGFRVYGNWARQIINVLQSCQFPKCDAIDRHRGSRIGTDGAGTEWKRILVLCGRAADFHVVGLSAWSNSYAPAAWILGQRRGLVECLRHHYVDDCHSDLWSE